MDKDKRIKELEKELEDVIKDKKMADLQKEIDRVKFNSLDYWPYTPFPEKYTPQSTSHNWKYLPQAYCQDSDFTWYNCRYVLSMP